MDDKIDEIRKQLLTCSIISRDDYVTFPCTYTIKDKTKPNQDITNTIKINVSFIDIITCSNDIINLYIEKELQKELQNGLDEMMNN